MNAGMLLTWAAGLLAVGLVLFGLELLDRSRREERGARVLQQAIDTRRAAPAPSPQPELPPLRRGLAWLEALGARLRGSRLEAALLAPEDRLLLDQAGWNSSRGHATYLAIRLVLAGLLPLLATVWLHPAGFKALAVLVGALAAGVLAPKYALVAWAGRLRRRAGDELPLLVDLLRLLQSVGFSMDQSLQMIAERFRPALPVLGRELQEANTAYMHGRPRPQSLRRLAESFGDDDLRSLVQMIVQVHQHGGAVQEPLRQFAERLRERRRMSMKEKVGKLSVKMTLVMMLTLLPALMLVLIGPALIALSGSIAKLAH
jgi:tight adherence protein C